jgi:hypothetical protein
MMNAWPPGSSRIKLAALVLLIAVLAIQPPSSRAQTPRRAPARPFDRSSWKARGRPAARRPSSGSFADATCSAISRARPV